MTTSATNGGFGDILYPKSPAHRSGAKRQTALPVRKHLPHAVPSWVDVGAVYFITINCVPREVNQLATHETAHTVETSFLHYQNISKWWIHYLLLMPDHLHGLISFGRDVAMRRIIADWKPYLARENRIEWQRDFFDHRIRDEESLSEKWHYIRHNPVRKQLVSEPDEWPYQWHNGQPRTTVINGGGFGETALPGRARSPSAPCTLSNDEHQKEEK